jgi:hypothetical protein
VVQSRRSSGRVKFTHPEIRHSDRTPRRIPAYIGGRPDALKAPA